MRLRIELRAAGALGAVMLSLWGGAKADAAVPDQAWQAWAAAPTQLHTVAGFGALQLQARVGAEAGAPNQHPAQLRRAELAAALAAIQAQQGGEVLALFSAAQVEGLAAAIEYALATAAPEQDLLFALAAAPQRGERASSGRVFVSGGRLHLILGSFAQTLPAGLAQAAGSRAREGRAELIGVRRGDAEIRRRDWIALALLPVPEPAASPSPIASPAPAPNPAAAASPVPAPLPAAPLAAAAAASKPAAPVSPAAATATAAPAADPAVRQHFGQQEGRLRLLQQLRQQGLLTEAEYQQRRGELLKAL